MGLCEIKNVQHCPYPPKQITIKFVFPAKLGLTIFFGPYQTPLENPTAELKTTDITFLWTNFKRLDLTPPDVSWSALVHPPNQSNIILWNKSSRPNHTHHNIPQSDEVFGASNDLCRNLEDACPGRTCRFRDKNDGRHLYAVRSVRAKDAPFSTNSSPLIATVWRKTNTLRFLHKDLVTFLLTKFDLYELLSKWPWTMETAHLLIW